MMLEALDYAIEHHKTTDYDDNSSDCHDKQTDECDTQFDTVWIILNKIGDGVRGYHEALINVDSKK